MGWCVGVLVGVSVSCQLFVWYFFPLPVTLFLWCLGLFLRGFRTVFPVFCEGVWLGWVRRRCFRCCLVSLLVGAPAGGCCCALGDWWIRCLLGCVRGAKLPVAEGHGGSVRRPVYAATGPGILGLLGVSCWGGWSVYWFAACSVPRRVRGAEPLQGALPGGWVVWLYRVPARSRGLGLK